MKLMIASDLHGSSYWCARMLEAYKKEKPDPNTQYQWTYRRPRHGGILRKIISAYLILQLLGWLLTSCSYSLYSPYYYGDPSQQSSGYSDSYTQPQSGYNSYGFGGGRQS